jgi:hypothetical protein
MKKVLILLAGLALVAAACNSKQSASTNIYSESNPAQSQSGQTGNSSNGNVSAQSQVDATVNDINAAVSSDSSTNMQSDSDVLNSDQSLTTSANGVSNVNY